MVQIKRVPPKINLAVGSFLALMVFGLVGKKIYDKFPIVQKIFKEIGDFFDLTVYAQANLTIGSIILFVIILTVGLKLSKFLSHRVVVKALSGTKLNKGAKASVENLSYYGFVVFFIILALYVAKVPLTIFTLLGGALAIGLGFASQNLLSNFISGVILQMEQPVNVGDVIEIEGTTGVVEHIGGRSTKILTGNNTHVILPNKDLLDKKVVNWTLQDNVIRMRVGLKVSVESDLQVVEKAIKDLLDNNHEIMENPVPRFYLEDMANSCFEYGIYFYMPVGVGLDRAKIESDIRRNLIQNLLAKKIKIYTAWK